LSSINCSGNIPEFALDFVVSPDEALLDQSFNFALTSQRLSNKEFRTHVFDLGLDIDQLDGVALVGLHDLDDLHLNDLASFLHNACVFSAFVCSGCWLLEGTSWDEVDTDRI